MTLPPFMSKQVARQLKLASAADTLAVAQAQWVKKQLEALGHTVELLQIANEPLQENADMYKAVLDGRADLAVQEATVLELPEELEVAAITKRTDPREVLLIREDALDTRQAIPVGIGASLAVTTPRRREQILRLRPDLALKDRPVLLPTALEKLHQQDYDAVLTAASYLDSGVLKLEAIKIHKLEPELLVPAAGQGSLALLSRRDAYEVASIVTALHHNESYKAVAAERGLLALVADAEATLGVHARYGGGQVNLIAYYQGQYVQAQNPSSENAALLAFDLLGRPHS